MKDFFFMFQAQPPLKQGSDSDRVVSTAQCSFYPLLMFQSLEFCGKCGWGKNPQVVGFTPFLTNFVYNGPMLNSPMLF